MNAKSTRDGVGMSDDTELSERTKRMGQRGEWES